MSLSKSAIIEKAQKLVLKGKIKQAIAEWKKLAAETPNDGNIYNAIGDLYLKSNDKPNATGAFIKAADAFQSAAFELKSIALYKKALKVDPSKIEIHEKLAAVYAERGLIGNAIDDYLKVAKFYYKNGNFRSALAVYRKLSNLDPENVNIRLEIAEMCQKQEVNEEAIEEYKKVVAIYDAKNQHDEAEQVREKITALDPSYAPKQAPELEKAASVPSSENEVEPEDIAQEAPEEAPAVSTEPELQEETAQGFLAPEAEPLAEEQTVFPSEHGMIADLPSQGAPEKGTDLSQFENALTEAEVYIQYGLIDKAIAQLKSLVTSFPSELKPHLKLKEIYTQQGMTQEAAETCQYLVKYYDTLGDEAAKKEVLADLQAFGTQGADVAIDSGVPAQPETKSGASYVDETMSNKEASSPEADPFGEMIGADSLSNDLSEPTLAALEEMATGEQSVQEGVQNTPASKTEDPLNALKPQTENDEYVDLNSILSEGFGGDEDEIESSLEKSFRDLQDVHDGTQDVEETETQYDLGIAYKEMGMLSEAMKAFELASKGESRFEDAMIMLASCHREEGSTPKAAEVLENALSDRKDSAGTVIALKYELALLYEKLGDKRFTGLYQEIFDADPSFRDIAKKYGGLTSKGHHHKQLSGDPKPAAPEKQKTRDRVSYL